VREILAGGGETKWADLDGFTALVYASMWGHAEVVGVLLQHLYKNQMKVKLLFQEIDEDGSGLLDLEEVLALTKSLGQDLSPQGLRVAMSQMDKDGSGEVDFDEFYIWWNEYVASGLGGGSGLNSLFDAKKKSFLGGDAELALMMAIANGRDDCRDLLVEAGADMDETMADYAKEQLRVNSAMEKKLWLKEEARRKEEARLLQGSTKPLKPAAAHDSSNGDGDGDGDGEERGSAATGDGDSFRRPDGAGRGRSVRDVLGGEGASKACVVQ
jgi:hypothetical protein